jgi:hypothetical protein
MEEMLRDSGQPAPSFQSVGKPFHPNVRSFVQSVLDAANRAKGNHKFEAIRR